MNKQSRYFVASVLVMSSVAIANNVTKITPSVEQPEVNKAFRLNFAFGGDPGGIACGIAIDWGDGKTERLRFGEGHQVAAPFSIEHTYTSVGQFKLKVEGEAIMRGIRSVPPCAVRQEGTLKVVDPIEEAKLAEARQAEERQKRERQEQMQAEARERKEREERERTPSTQSQAQQAQAARAQPTRPQPSPQEASQKYIPVASKKYKGIIACEKDPSTPDTYNILQQAMKIHAGGNLEAFEGFTREMRKWCKTMNTPAQADKLGNVVFEFERGGKHYLSLAVSNGFQNFRQGGSVMMLPTWTIYGIVGD